MRAPRGEDNVTDLFHHAKVVRECAARLGATGEVDLLNFQLHVAGPDYTHTFRPQFLYFDQDDRRQYSPALREGSTHFMGWLPYFNKRWPLALDKLDFKQFCSENGLRTPPHRTDADPALRDFIIKKRHSSFGNDIRGPFAAFSESDPQQRLLEGEFYEQFVRGHIAKVWYWEAKPACLEMPPMPTVTGDGRRSMYDLIAAAAEPRPAPPRSELDALARYQDVSLDDVLPAGRSFLADFRYGSNLRHRGRASSNVLADYAASDIAHQLDTAGSALWRGAIPADLRADTLWTLDAIVDDASTVWLLEMNCNPMVHPDAYYPVLEGIFGPAHTPPAA
jgi:hypothetical protein